MKSLFCFSRYENSTTDSLEESLSPRTTKENLSKQELHKVSEKLSRRLNELDLVSEIFVVSKQAGLRSNSFNNKNVNLILMKRKSAVNT